MGVMRKGRSTLVNSSKVKAAKLRPLRSPLYDEEFIAVAPAAAIGRLEYFSNRRTFTAGGAKSEANTNMTDDGRLSEPGEFTLFGLSKRIRMGTAVADLNTAYNAGFLDIFMHTNTNFGKYPLQVIPSFIAPLAFTTVAATTLFSNGMPGPNNILNLSDDLQQGRHIGRGETFRVVVQWPVAINTTVNTFIIYLLHGILYVGM
jgi:hypothetical protein